MGLEDLGTSRGADRRGVNSGVFRGDPGGAVEVVNSVHPAPKTWVEKDRKRPISLATASPPSSSFSDKGRSKLLKLSDRGLASFC